MSTRMSSEELDRILMDRAGKHHSQDEVEDLRQMFAGLRENSMVTADHQHHIAQRKAQRAIARRPNGLVWAGAIATLAVLASVPLEVHHRRELREEQARMHADAIRRQQLEQSTDEALLLNVQSDLSSSVAQPLAPLSVKFDSASTGNTKGTNE